jgi:hypothetical protein
MAAVSTSETLVNFYKTTRRYISENSHLHTCRCEDLKSHKHIHIHKTIHLLKLTVLLKGELNLLHLQSALIILTITINEFHCNMYVLTHTSAIVIKSCFV